MVTVDVAVAFTMDTVVKGDSVEFSAVGGGNIAERSSLKNEILIYSKKCSKRVLQSHILNEYLFEFVLCVNGRLALFL